MSAVLIEFLWLFTGVYTAKNLHACAQTDIPGSMCTLSMTLVVLSLIQGGSACLFVVIIWLHIMAEVMIKRRGFVALWEPI
ncbi:hypothetical protein BV22DRAFT_486673 [Leucogyrophana mollusca]|uniref:Uncharacterized protein n=1 Tax=Leucogyrophana mollusca TaxID=85980 RepID=A0ACB8BGV9_9AGAM|nr:hypothetical protein BV22DRAFT_486673 [Leucogyrophana mollusca]